MRRVALIYNPVSGISTQRREARIAEAAEVLRRAGVTVETIATESAESAGPQATKAAQDGCDAVIACGGDGTVHAVLQALVGGPVALGVIPMGTANALAADLGIPGSAAKAAKMLLGATPVLVPAGRLSYVSLEGEERSRYFIVAAGIGADGVFFSRIDSRMKQRLGYLHYLLEAIRLGMTHTFPYFAATFTERGVAPRTEKISQLLAVRISDFGGLVRRLVPGAAIHKESLRVIAFKTRSRLVYFRFMAAVWFKRHTYSKTIELVNCVQVECSNLNGSSERLYVEADGEMLGTLPVKIEVVPQAVNLLVPEKLFLSAGLVRGVSAQ